MLLLLLPFSAWSVTLGDARALSYLGQPLHLQVQLVGADAASIAETRISIGRQADFDRLSMVYQHQLSLLQMHTRNSDGRWVVDIRSEQPFTQPFIEFPLSLQYRGSRLVKGVTTLLDPPSYARAAPPAATQAAPAPIAAEYRVQHGDTLWPIAQRLKPAGIGTRQMMMALLRHNPHAFIDGDLDRLRSGALLAVPPLPRIQETNADLPARKPVRPQLQVVQPDVAERMTREAMQRRVLLTDEEVERTRLEQQQMRQQIALLRQQVAHMQRLINLKDEQIATLQSLAESRQAPVAASDPGEDRAVPVAATPPASDAALPAPRAVAADDPSTGNAAAVDPLTAAILDPAPTAAGAPAPGTPLWWWPLALLGLSGPALLWAWQRRREQPLLDIRLAEHPAIMNAGPKPYSTQASPPVDTPKAAARRGAAPAETLMQTSRSVPQRNTSAAGPEPASSDSLLDEPLGEVADLAGAAPRISERLPMMPPSEDEELISEEELRELARQLSSETEAEIDPGSSLPDAAEPAARSTYDGDDEVDMILDLARAYQELGDPEGATEILERALEQSADATAKQRIHTLLQQMR